MGSNDKALSRRRFLRFAAAGLGAASVAGVLAACGAAAPAADGTAAEAGASHLESASSAPRPRARPADDRPAVRGA